MVSDEEVYNKFYKFRETEKFKEFEEKLAKAFKELKKIQDELEKEYPLNENFTYVMFGDKIGITRYINDD